MYLDLEKLFKIYEMKKNYKKVEKGMEEGG